MVCSEVVILYVTVLASWDLEAMTQVEQMLWQKKLVAAQVDSSFYDACKGFEW